MFPTFNSLPLSLKDNVFCLVLELLKMLFQLNVLSSIITNEKLRTDVAYFKVLSHPPTGIERTYGFPAKF